MLEERERIADDLHDFVSQELFATAMQIETIADDVPADSGDGCLRTLEHVKRAQREVRGVMGQLQGAATSEPLGERCAGNSCMAAGFARLCRIAHGGRLGGGLAAVGGDPTLSDDIVAVVRESLSNIARHARSDARCT